MFIDTNAWPERMQNAHLTAENHGKAHELQREPRACRAEIRKVVLQHHSDVSADEAETIAEVVLAQWQADRSEYAALQVAQSPLTLVKQMADIAQTHELIVTDYSVLADGTVDIRFGEGGCDFDRYINLTLDDEGADLDVGGFINDLRAGIQIGGVPSNSKRYSLPNAFVVAVNQILKQ